MADTDLWAQVSPRLTDARRQRMIKTAGQRTKHVRLIMQDVHNPHNVAACLRSAEAFGLQDVHVVTLGETFRASSVAKGVGHWIHIHKHASIASCVEDLRQSGFRIVSAMPDPNVHSLSQVPVDHPLAVLFGNEHAGISEEWKPYVDSFFTIPMVGMVESLNISVSAAITLYTLTQRCREVLAPDAYFFSPSEQRALLSEWV
ncbi:MAG: RNA methyltransferase [Deltaproteobacteria bacterium]|nr:RNA methyltransferase [Deltaproteobacteria bacterium]